MNELKEIRIRRLKLGLNQGGLAKLAGVSQSLVAKLESGKLEPSYSNAVKLFGALEREEKKSEETAENLMNGSILVLDASEKISKAIGLMKKEGISQIPIVDSKVLVGSISEKIILQKLIEFNLNLKDFSNLKISEVMGETFPTIDEKCPVSIISQLLSHNEAVIVMKKGEILGIITKTDLFKI